MSGQYQTIEGAGGAFSAYIARPAAAKAPAVVVLQEIFGVNAFMRGVCEDLAAKGFIAICPDLFWRIQPGIDITDKTETEWNLARDYMGRFDAEAGMGDIAATIDTVRRDPACTGKVGVVGYCLGGRLAMMTAARTDIDASVSYYGVGLDRLLGEADQIKRPLMLHIAEQDGYLGPGALERLTTGLKDNPQVNIHIYPGRDHAFARTGGKNYNAEAADLANRRTLDFLKTHLA